MVAQPRFLPCFRRGSCFRAISAIQTSYPIRRQAAKLPENQGLRWIGPQVPRQRSIIECRDQMIGPQAIAQGAIPFASVRACAIH